MPEFSEEDLSVEDIRWVEAFAQRAMLENQIGYEPAYEWAHDVVLTFYQRQLIFDGKLQREPEESLHSKRLFYEWETAQQVRQKEEWRIAGERHEQACIRRKSNERRRQECEAVLAAEFKEAGGRNRWCLLKFIEGARQCDLAELIGVSRARVGGIIAQARRREYLLHLRRMRPRLLPLGRPIDMGGRRDVWLTYYPPADPRLDNMEPIV